MSLHASRRGTFCQIMTISGTTVSCRPISARIGNVALPPLGFLSNRAQIETMRHIFLSGSEAKPYFFSFFVASVTIRVFFYNVSYISVWVAVQRSSSTSSTQIRSVHIFSFSFLQEEQK